MPIHLISGYSPLRDTKKCSENSKPVPTGPKNQLNPHSLPIDEISGQSEPSISLALAINSPHIEIVKALAE
ncbi:Uncharacterized protein TCM_016712 [Theobroma cacao]|uniref:Uncharacterized protein n=1 Tax=Theobroma cacao TaxID=3641 RepID=A0A061G8A1_THECC|nr:Uncharacterized protein TCM_016712 [Theobroma cacao]